MLQQQRVDPIGVLDRERVAGVLVLDVARPGMPAAMARPNAGGAIGSCRPLTTRVGTPPSVDKRGVTS